MNKDVWLILFIFCMAFQLSGCSKADLQKQADAYIQSASTHAHRGDYSRAIAGYTKALRLKPNYADAYHTCGLAYYNKGGCRQAMADYSKAISLNPNLARDTHSNNGKSK